MWKTRIFFIICILNYISIEMAGASFYLTQWKKREKLPPCDTKKLIDFLAEVQVVDPESIIKQATLNELEPLCKKITKGLESTHSYLKHCEPQFQKDLYLRLIKGVDSLHDKLCKKHGDFMEAFKKHHACCHKTNYAGCTGPADWVEDSNVTKICSAYKSLSHCYYSTTAKHCGDEAGKIIKELFDAVVVSVLTVNCTGLKNAEATANKQQHSGNTANKQQHSGKETNSVSIPFYLCLFYIFTIILKNINHCLN